MRAQVGSKRPRATKPRGWSGQAGSRHGRRSARLVRLVRLVGRQQQQQQQQVGQAGEEKMAREQQVRKGRCDAQRPAR